VRAAAACALALLALAAGCGGDDEEEPPEREPAATAPTEPGTTGQEPKPRTTEEGDTTAPEEEGGQETDPEAEEPVRSEAVFTARNGRITPRRIEVPAYIAITVVLRPKDERDYSITMEGKRMSVGGNIEEAFLSLDGLRPGERYLGSTANGRRLVISATAEPGP
jgi:hypothetical protein